MPATTYHGSCHCGAVRFEADPVLGGAFVSVQLTALDDATPEELAAAPVHVSNGRDNDWMHAPAEIRHH